MITLTRNADESMTQFAERVGTEAWMNRCYAELPEGARCSSCVAFGEVPDTVELRQSTMHLCDNC